MIQTFLNEEIYDSCLGISLLEEDEDEEEREVDESHAENRAEDLAVHHSIEEMDEELRKLEE
mgnify:CR=1 FL=1